MKKKSFAIIVLIIFSLLMMAGGVYIGANWSSWFGYKPAILTDNTPNDFKIDAAAGEWDMNTSTEPDTDQIPGIQIPGYPEIPIAGNTQDVKIALMNPGQNPCYFKFQIILEESEEVLYTSDWVPPGQSIGNQKLSRTLETGRHKAIIRITTASLDEAHTPMNGSDVKTTLVVS